MPQASPFEILNKICKESELFDSKDRLLNFSTKGDFQTPLRLESGDTFYEKWLQGKNQPTLQSFMPVSQNFSAQQKIEMEEQFKAVLKTKDEDFLCSDLYLILGFLKWDGNALAPSLLVPLDVAPDQQTLTLGKQGPIENVILRDRLINTVTLPTVEDATLQGKFSILLYFSLFEKAIAQEKTWKFTRHGLCLAFFNTNRLRLKKRLKKGFDEKEANSPFLQSLLGDEGFQFKESVFEEADFDQVFNPADHHFLYPTDSHTNKVTIDALDEKSSAYAVQSLPGTSKYKVAANIVAESLSKNKRTLVVARRSISMQNFRAAFAPMFRSFSGPERDTIEKDLRDTREYFSSYYSIVNNDLPVAKAPLSDILDEFIRNPAVKAKIPDAVFQGVAELPYDKYMSIKATLEEIVSLYFKNNGIEARNAFKKIKVSSLDAKTKAKVAEDLNAAAAQVESLKPLISIFEESGLLPTGIYLSAFAELLNLIQVTFNQGTPEFEEWELRSNNWSAYQDTLKALPEAGDKWVRYRRQASDIYTDDAVDTNVLATREEFAESLKATLKGLSDHYRNSRKRLLKVIKNPKSVSSDMQLLDLIDSLIELQEDKRAYKDTSVLGNHLLGKDWLYEKSNWVELNQKIQYLYDFRETHKNDPHLDLLLLVLENWHKLKPELENFEKYSEILQALTYSVRSVSNNLALETPLESLSIDKWLDEIQAWNQNWDNLDIHIKISALINSLEAEGCTELAKYASNTSTIHKDFAKAFAHHWAASQVHAVTKKNPQMFSLDPKARHAKGKLYRAQMDQFSNANFREVHALVEAKPDMLTIASLEETFSLVAQHYDVAVILDADCISVAESFASICTAHKVILIGDPHMPSIEAQPFDAFRNILPRQSAFFQENILAAALRKGIPTREIWFCSLYNDISLVNFANDKIYNHGIKQLPMPNREKPRCESLMVVPDKVMAIAKAAVQHAEKHPGQTLGIIAFHQARCFEIEAAIKALVAKDSPAARYFGQTNPLISYYIKTPDRVIDKYRDVVMVCVEVDNSDKISADRKLSVCTTLAKQELMVFVSSNDLEKQKAAKSNLFWEWINHLQKKTEIELPVVEQTESKIRPQIIDALKEAGVIVENSFAPGGIAVGPVVVDANYSKRFLAVVEDDCTTERFRESVEDREYVRPSLLRQLGWKVLDIWQPLWFLSNQAEKEHLVTTIAIEQSVAPPPPEDDVEGGSEEFFNQEPELDIKQYQVVNPKIEGTAHAKPIAELPAISIIAQLKFYVDHEAPIHEEILMRRLLELHGVDRAGPMILQALNDAVKLGFQKKKFIKTGKFFYSTKDLPVALRDRSTRPEYERKMAYVSPEERALLPASMDERTIKQTLGLLE